MKRRDFLFRTALGAGFALLGPFRQAAQARPAKTDAAARAQIIRFPELKCLLRSCGLRPEDFALTHSDLPLRCTTAAPI